MTLNPVRDYARSSKGKRVFCASVRSILVRAAFLICAFCFFSSCTEPVRSDGETPKAVFVILDGIAADVIEKLELPALDDISKAGGFTRAYVGGRKGTYTETPTISAVGYNSLLTGTWVNKHNVWGNDIKDPNYHYWNIFRIVEAHDPQLETAIFSTWTDNRTRLVGEGLAETGKIMLDYKFDGLELDTVQYPHDDSSHYIHRIDEAVAAEAAKYIRNNGPDVSWVYLQYTDDMGHRFGDSERFYQAVRIADKQVAKIWNAIKEREKEFDENWLILITTDHGRDSVSGRKHGGQSDRERLTWIVTNATNLNERFGQTPAVVDIMPSILNHLDIAMPEEVSKETDGIPFIGEVDLADLKAEKKNGKIVLTWKSLKGANGENAKIFISETNHFKEGGNDLYREIGEVDINAERYTFDVDTTKHFYKILVKASHHYTNAWVVEKK
jgi:predicted AlkP superfamily pyrophosphatase or phosphodiesterase